MTDIGYRPEQHVTPGLRNGARVRCIRGDGFIDEGMTGIVINTAPPRPRMPPRARVLWDESEGTQLACMIDGDRLEVIPGEPAEPKPPRQLDVSPFTNWQKQQQEAS